MLGGIGSGIEILFRPLRGFRIGDQVQNRKRRPMEPASANVPQGVCVEMNFSHNYFVADGDSVCQLHPIRHLDTHRCK